MLFPSHSRLFYRPNDTWREIKIFKIKSSEHRPPPPPPSKDKSRRCGWGVLCNFFPFNELTHSNPCVFLQWCLVKLKDTFTLLTLFYLTLQDTKRRQFTAKQCKDSQESLCHWPRSHSCGLSWPRWPRWGWHEARTRWRTRRRQEGPLCDVSSSRSARTVPVRRRLLWESRSSSLANAHPTLVSRDSSVGIATRYGLDGPGIESRWRGARISAPVQAGPWAHPASYTMVNGSFPGVKRPGHGVDHPRPSNPEVKERVDPYLYSTSGPSWPVTGWTLPLPLPPTIQTNIINKCTACLRTFH